MKLKKLTILILLLLPFCNALGQKIEALNDSTFVCNRAFVEMVAERFDSLERVKALQGACEITLNYALSFKDSCNSAILQCEALHDQLAMKSEKQSLIIKANKEQLAILSRSNDFLSTQIKRQRRKNNKQKFFAVGGGVVGGFIIGALTVLLAR